MFDSAKELLDGIRLGESACPFNEQVIPGASLDDLDAGLADRFRTSRTGESRNELLSKLRMAAPDQSGILRPTVAGALMASDARAWLPNAFIQAVAYRGDDVRIGNAPNPYQMDAVDIAGTLDQQVLDACRFVVRNMRVMAYKWVGRRDVPQYDIAAVFEAVVNAVAHRDYSIQGSKIRLRMFEHRLELYSPGAIPNAMTVDSLPHLQSTRNEVVTSLLAKCAIPPNIPWLETDRLTMMDRRGEGVRIILDNSERLSGKEPEYRMIDDAELSLTIHGARP